MPTTSGAFAADGLKRLRRLARRAAPWPLAIGLLLIRKAVDEWHGSFFHLRWLDWLADPRRLATSPGVALKSPEVGHPDRGRRLLAGIFDLAGAEMVLGAEGDPWDRPSPSRRFAEALHGFDWLADLLTMGEAGTVRALTLTLDWERLFGRWSDFSWEAEIAERRLTRLSCHLRPLLAKASDLETLQLTAALARQAHYLLSLRRRPQRASERAAAVALAGCALGGPAGQGLLDRALRRLERRLAKAVGPEGGHASRSARQGAELFQQLAVLETGLTLRGRVPTAILVSSREQLAAATRFLTLSDGALAAFHGGEDRPSPLEADHPIQAADQLGGYQRLQGARLQVMVDAAPPPQGVFSVTACGQPLALEVLAGGARLISNCGWSADGLAPHALRLAEAGSCGSLGDASAGAPLSGWLAAGLGPLLAGGARQVTCQRQTGQGADWLELSHDAWADRFGLIHERRLYLDHKAHELRGEDQLRPLGPQRRGEPDRRVLPFAVRFHLHPSIRQSLARDELSVLLQTPDGTGWRMRGDGPQISIEPSVHYREGLPRRTACLVMRVPCRIARGARIRWKLSLAEGRVDSEGSKPIVRPSA